jgi:hypothetical protein
MLDVQVFLVHTAAEAGRTGGNIWDSLFRVCSRNYRRSAGPSVAQVVSSQVAGGLGPAHCAPVEQVPIEHVGDEELLFHRLFLLYPRPLLIFSAHKKF